MCENVATYLFMFFIVFTGTIALENGGSKTLADQIAEQINNTLIEVASKIGDINVNKSINATSGEQEFGKFTLEVANGTNYGFGDFVAEIITVQIIPPILKNLTLHFRNLTFDFDEYDISGHIQFPIGNQQFPLIGHGKLRASILNLVLSMSMKIGLKENHFFVKDLILFADIGEITLQMENLMGGGDLGWAFGSVLNDLAVTIFDYYKNDIIAAYNEPITEMLSAIIDRVLHPNSTILSMSDYDNSVFW